ncbi:MAG TPA: glycosyl hydrolase-related protein [Candidatus Limnocylindrales bacterium]|nr:glycosyl hydrolase-related protein [Candidatus Limnocylindrales bacterium]
MKTRTGNYGALFLVVLFVAVFCCPAGAQTQADTNVVWQIGKFDQTSGEFGHDFDLESENLKPVFTVGQSKTSDWPAWQTTSVGSGTGKHPTPYTILFSLPKPPVGMFHLTISVFLVNPSVPDLIVELNGRKGRFFFDRKISYYPGDDRIDSPIYGGDTLEIDLPARFLKVGENKLILTAVEDAENPETRASLIYDALKLTQGPSGKLEPHVTVKPTVFFKEKDNQRFEVTTVTVTATEKLGAGSVDFSLGKEHFRAALPAANDFGQERVEFDVPEFSGPAAASVAIRANGKTYRSSTTVSPERKWSIYFVPHAHLDIGYTDYQAKVAELQNRNIDKLLEFLPKNPGMKFSLDGSWVAQNYFATRDESAKKQLLQYIHEGKVSVPAQYSNLLTGYASLEELIRSLSYAHALHRSEGVPFEYANITDVPSVTWSYPSILNAAGIKYFAEATNSDRGPIVLYGRWNEKSPFWREGPDGSRILMANTRQYSQLWFVCELPPEVGNCCQGLPGYLQQFSAPDYKPDAVLMFGSQLENTDARLSEPEFLAKWSASYAYPKFILSSFPDYFRYIEQKFGAQLATVSGDGGPYWEDGVGSDARNTAIDRNNQTRALSAEKLATVSRYLNPSLAVQQQLLDRIWTNLLLYAEHTWDSWDSVYRPDSQESIEQLATKDEYPAETDQAVKALTRQSLSQIADQVHMPSGSLVVFNALSWPRSGLVELDLERGTILTEFSGKTPVPFEALREGAGYSHVRFLAKDVPAMGFKCYTLQPGQVESERSSPAAKESAVVPADTIENAYYRVQVDASTGTVKSIFDKQLNRELVDTASPYRFNQYLYVEKEGKDATQIVYMRKSLPQAELKITPSHDGRIVGVRKTPFGQILEVESKSVHTPSVRSEILLYDGDKKIEFVNHITKDPVRDKEAVYFAFPVAAQKPSFRYEIQNGSVDPSKDMIKGAGLEWFSVAHWVRASAGDAEVAIVPVDAPLVTLGDINRGIWPEEFVPKTSTIFSYVYNNYWHTNYRAEQGGEATFRYAMTSGPSLSEEALARFGREAMTPLETDQVIDQDKVGNPPRPLEPGALSFLQVDGPNVVVEAWKAAEDGNGTVLRLLETAGKESVAKIRFPLLHLEQAWLCNAMEENQKELSTHGSSLEISLRPHQIVTLRIRGQFQLPKK